MSSGMDIIACVLCNYAASVWGIHTHPLCLANWVALEGYLTAKGSRCPGLLLLEMSISSGKKAFGRTTKTDARSVAVLRWCVYTTQVASLNIPLLAGHRQITVVVICLILNAAQLVIRAREAQRSPRRKSGRLR